MPAKLEKPKSKAHQRFLENRDPKLIENDKKCLFLRGGNTSELTTKVMKMLFQFKKQTGVQFHQKNMLRPFEDPSSLEFFSSKNDTGAGVWESRMSDQALIPKLPSSHKPKPSFSHVALHFRVPQQKTTSQPNFRPPVQPSNARHVRAGNYRIQLPRQTRHLGQQQASFIFHRLGLDRKERTRTLTQHHDRHFFRRKSGCGHVERF